VPDDAQVPAGLVADPLAQALILTAIVIGFGVLAFAVVLIRRAYEVVEADDMNQMRDTDT
jgi:multicomponent Na+:H+ antiporter subunit C